MARVSYSRHFQHHLLKDNLMAKVTLFYLSPNNTGGWVTFTAHLVRSLEMVGVEVSLRKITKRTERNKRDFGYGLKYQNTTIEDAVSIAANEATLIVAAAKKFKDITEDLLLVGSKIVIHDPTEIKNIPDYLLDNKDIVTIRKMGQKYLQNLFAGLDDDPIRFIRHPYVRKGEGFLVNKGVHAVSTSRIDYDKNTAIILRANDLIDDPEKHVRIHGFENRLYTSFKLRKEFPEWEQSVRAYPRTIEAAFYLLREAKYMVDMSLIKHDGGGTQYTFLEAWDAGALPIIHEGWLSDGDDMINKVNCLSISSGEELADLLQNGDSHYAENINSYQDFFEKSLAKHDPILIGNQYREFLGLDQA